MLMEECSKSAIYLFQDGFKISSLNKINWLEEELFRLVKVTHVQVEDN